MKSRIQLAAAYHRGSRHALPAYQTSPNSSSPWAAYERMRPAMTTRCDARNTANRMAVASCAFQWPDPPHEAFEAAARENRLLTDLPYASNERSENTPPGRIRNRVAGTQGNGSTSAMTMKTDPKRAAPPRTKPPASSPALRRDRSSPIARRIVLCRAARTTGSGRPAQVVLERITLPDRTRCQPQANKSAGEHTAAERPSHGRPAQAASAGTTWLNGHYLNILRLKIGPPPSGPRHVRGFQPNRLNKLQAFIRSLPRPMCKSIEPRPHRRRRPKYDSHAEARSLPSAENAIARDGSSVPHFAFRSTFRLPAAIVP